MSRKITVNETGANYELYFPDGTPNYFADGFQLLIGWPNSKVIYHTLAIAASPEEPVEQRDCTLRLTVPTSALLQLAQQVVATMAQNNQPLIDAVSKYNEQFTKGMPSVSPSAAGNSRSKDLA